MNEALLVVVLALAWFAATNLAVSLVAWALTHVLARTRLMTAPIRAGRILLALSLLPGAVSLFFTVALFLPAQWHLEPEGARESAGYSLVLFAASGAGILLATAYRAIRDTRATASVVRRWRRLAARDGNSANVAFGIPVIGVAGRVPLISLVGVLRPTLFVGDEVKAVLSDEELEVSLAHEAAHHRAMDNLKRLLVAWSPDALRAFGLNRRPTESWHAAIEFAADARAAGGSDRRAVALAAALIKVARLAAPHGRPALAHGSRLDGQGLLAARVDRLLKRAPAADAAESSSRWTWAGATLLTTAMLLVTEPTWHVVHEATEAMIRFLP